MKNRSTVPTFLLAMAFLLSLGSSEAVLAHEDGEEVKPNSAKRGSEFRQRMLKRFDADGDGELSEDERAEARKEMRRRRKEQGSRGSKDGLLPERGPRKDFQQPLRNEGGPSKGRGPRADQERRDGRNHRQRDSDRAPDPNKVFDRFDVDGDGQLSREEFHKLAKTMHRMRGGHKGHRMGKGHGKRSGPPGEGRRKGQRHGGRAEGDSDRPRNRGPLRQDSDGTSGEANPVPTDSL